MDLNCMSYLGFEASSNPLKNKYSAYQNYFGWFGGTSSVGGGYVH